MIDECDHSNNPNATLLEQQALSLLSYILDTRYEKEIREKLILRKKHKAIDPYYIPWNRPTLLPDPSQFTSRNQYLLSLVSRSAINELEKRNIHLTDYGKKADKDGSKSYFSL